MNFSDYRPVTLLDISYKEVVKTREVVEERHVEHSCYSRQTTWITEKFIDGILVSTSLVLGPLTFIDYKQR